MNITPPLPASIPFSTANINTEAAQRDNQKRETVPAATAGQQSAADRGANTDSEQIKNNQKPLVYDKPQSQVSDQNGNSKDNGEDASAGKQSDSQSQTDGQSKEQQAKIDELKKRDTEVRQHEQAHARVGGQYAGPPSYEYDSGPDGQRYAVGGEVSIDISAAETPEKTLQKMEQVHSAALAPVQPSSQDLQVAQEALRKASKARAEISAAAAQQNQPLDKTQPQGETKPSSTENIVHQQPIDSSQRSLKQNDPVAQAGGAEVSLESPASPAFLRQDNIIATKAARIASYYGNIDQPSTSSFTLSA